MILGKNIKWKFQHKTRYTCILNDVSFELMRGRITAFIGKSGAGKTTLLKCIGHLHSEYEGIITCDGEDIKKLSHAARASNIGLVLQQFHLFPHLTVLQNCTFALKEKEEHAAIELLKQLGMQPFIHAYPSQLSGGQQQRVAIARALVLRPKILLLDEPTSALDPESKKSLESILLDLQAMGLTLALSSHDMPFVRKVMDCIYYLEEGSLVEKCDTQFEDLTSKAKIKQFLLN